MRRLMLDSQNTPSVQTPVLKGRPTRQFVDTPPSSGPMSFAGTAFISFVVPSSTVSVIASFSFL